MVTRAKKSNAAFYRALIGLAVVGAALIAYVATKKAQGPKAVTIDPNLPPLAAQGYVEGNPSAPVQVIEFGDFECPACGNFAVVTEPDVRSQLIATGKMSLRFLDFPLPMHKNTWPAHEAAACAGEQGTDKFWAMHDKLYGGQDEWNGEATSRPKPVFARYAQEIGLDAGKWAACFDSQKYQRQIAGNAAEGERRNVGQTPSFIIGGKLVAGAVSFDEMKALVDSAAKSAPAKKDSTPATKPAKTA